jgi:hypothetical protein
MKPILILAVLALLAPATAAQDGTGSFMLVWEEPDDPEIAGYRISYGDAQGSHPHHIAVDKIDRYEVTGLDDCREWFFVVRSVDQEGEISRRRSNEVHGMPRPRIDLVRPSVLEVGRRYDDLVVEGANFGPGVAVEIDHPGVRVISTTRNECDELETTIEIAENVEAGIIPVYVVNGDRSCGESTLELVLEMDLPGNVGGADRTDDQEES